MVTQKVAVGTWIPSCMYAVCTVCKQNIVVKEGDYSKYSCDIFSPTTTDPPMISSLSPTDGRAPVNTHHIIQCTFEGLPIPNVEWAHNGDVLSDAPNDTNIATGDTSSTLTITTVTADDSGSYTCMVSNLLGSNMGSSMLLVQCA